MKRQILVIDDNDADTAMLELILARAEVSFEFHCFADGESAFKYIQEPATGRPDLVVLDLSLPRINGLNILELIKRQPSWNSVPVLVWSSASSPRDRSRIAELGARYIVKPGSLETFLEIGPMIAELLEGSGASAPLSIAAPE